MVALVLRWYGVVISCGRDMRWILTKLSNKVVHILASIIAKVYDSRMSLRVYTKFGEGSNKLLLTLFQ